ncbi:hypothetical protein DFJ77DRAFT_509866 [Powellomyces hirtus]|nr:hypothetical protein DFJ77DRAFT_509866 [Powellomyces hirtus]
MAITIRDREFPNRRLDSGNGPSIITLALSKECKERGIPILEAWKTCLRASGGAGEVVSGTIPGLLDDTEEAAESSPAHSPEPETILSRLRPRKRLANPSSSSEDEDALPTPSPTASNRFRTSRTAEGDRTNKNEYNTPRWLANLVNRFFPLLNLDAASNPESYIRSSMTYGLQMDGSFINTLRLAEWTVSHPRCALTKASTVYINPPSVYVTQNQAADDSTKERWLIPKFVDKLLEVLDSGRVDEALLLHSLDPSQRWCQNIYGRSLICQFNKSLIFEMTKAAKSRYQARSNAKVRLEQPRTDAVPRAMYYL